MSSRGGRLDGGARSVGRYARAGGLCALAAAMAVVGLGATSTPAEAVFPGMNGRIACEGVRAPEDVGSNTRRSEIFSVNPDGSDERLLTNNATRDGDPAFSPDGTKIAFEARRVDNQPENSEIYVANNDAGLSDMRRLTFNNGELSDGGQNNIAATDRSPSWSPDGTEIVFHSGREATFDNDGATERRRDVEIYKMSATNGERAEDGGKLERLTNRLGQDAIPSWSPDGGRIAFQSLRSGTSFDLEILTMNPDGGDIRNLSNNPGTPDDPATPGREDSDAIDSFGIGWSPDGSQLAFASTRDNETPSNQNFEIYKVNRDGSNPTRLTANASGDTPGLSVDYDSVPTWSPDGTRILFHSGRTSTASEDEFVAYTMDAVVGEAGGLQRVAETNIFARCDWQALAIPPVPVPVPVPPGPAPVSPPALGAVLFPAKVQVERARVLRADRRLDVLAPITARASGEVEVEFQAAGERTEFTEEVDSENRRIRFNRQIPAEQAELGTGILTLSYRGDGDTSPQEVRLRAASQPADLDLERPVIEDGRVKARGTISDRARGVVRLQVQYVVDGQAQTVELQGEIDDGEWEIDEALSQGALAGIAARRGPVHSYTLFTGFFERRIRGEMESFQILPDR